MRYDTTAILSPRYIIAILKKKKNRIQCFFFFLHFKVKLFYLMHFESSKLRAPAHVLN